MKAAVKHLLPRRHWDALRRIKRRTRYLSAPKVMAHLELIKGEGFAPGLVMDVGAARGDWSASCMQIFPEADYVLLEPLPEHREDLEKLTKNTKARYISAAAGSVAGRLPLLIPDDSGGSSFLNDQGGGFFKRTLDVDVVALDELELPGPVSLLKLDVQGYELQVLAGASDVLAETEVLIAECSFYEFQVGIPLVHEVIEFVVQHGFRLFDVGDEVRTERGRLAQIDLIFVRESSHLLTYHL